MVGILLSYWGGLFSGATLVSGRVTPWLGSGQGTWPPSFMTQNSEKAAKNLLKSWAWEVFSQTYPKFPNFQNHHICSQILFQDNINSPQHSGVSKNMGTSKSSILIGFSLINHPFWGTTIFGNAHSHQVIK